MKIEINNVYYDNKNLIYEMENLMSSTAMRELILKDDEVNDAGHRLKKLKILNINGNKSNCDDTHKLVRLRDLRYELGDLNQLVCRFGKKL